MNDLNEDVNRVNGLPKALEEAVEAAEAARAAAREAEGREAATELLKELIKSLPADVDPSAVGLKAKMDAFIKAQSSAGWKNFDAAADKLKKTIADEAAEVQRQADLRAVSEEFRQTLRYGERDKLTKAAAADGAATAASLRAQLEAALDEQRKPNKGRWAKYLDLGAGGSYTLKDGGSFGGAKIHVTMSKDSWTANADGKVSLMAGTAENVLEKLLCTDGWKQMHATLEVNKPGFPHVYLFDGVLAGDKRWEAARVALNKEEDWVEDAQAAMKGILAVVKGRLVAKINEARKVNGANVY